MDNGASRIQMSWRVNLSAMYSSNNVGVLTGEEDDECGGREIPNGFTI